MNTPELAVLRRGGEPKTKHLIVIRELGREEYEKCAEASELLRRFIDGYLKFTMTKKSYAEYMSLLRAYDQEYSTERPLDMVRAMSVKQEVNRRLRGFLAEMRSFLEHAEAELERMYGKESDELNSFLKAKSQIFDSSPSYRLVNKLRDYALHRNLAIQSMSYGSRLDTETGEVQSSLSFHVIRDELLQTSFNWTKHVKPYLEELPEQFAMGSRRSSSGVLAVLAVHRLGFGSMRGFEEALDEETLDALENLETPESPAAKTAKTPLDLTPEAQDGGEGSRRAGRACQRRKRGRFQARAPY